MYKNSEGYVDPTAYAVLKRTEKEETKRFRKLLRGIFQLCNRAGFRIEGRIILVDLKTGRVWK